VAETVLNQQEPKLDPKSDIQRQSLHLKKIVGIILCLVMLGLTVYVLKLQNQNFNILANSTQLALTASDHANDNYRAYVGKFKETKLELDETTSKLKAVNLQLDQVTAELSTAKGMIAQTQEMLSQAQDENAKLKVDLQGLDELRNSENVKNIDELEAKIKVLKDRDSQVTAQLADLKSQLRVFQGEFSDTKEGRSLIILFQNKINMVKNRMHHLSHEAFLARVAAQKEKDRLASLNGNSGFMVRDGHLQNPDGTKKTFAIDVKIEQ